MPSDGVGRVCSTMNKNLLGATTSLGRSHLFVAAILSAGIVMSASGFAVAQAQSKNESLLQTREGPELAQADTGPARLQAGQHRFDIEAQSLSSALVVFSRISGVDVVFDGVLPDGATSAGVNGDMTAASALDILLRQSGLAWSVINQSTISIANPQQDNAQSSANITEPITVTAAIRNLGPNGVPDEVYETPGSIAVITQESMRKAPVREVRDIFNNVAGVDVSNDARDPGLTVNVRGQQEMGRVNVNIDGARQNYNQLTHGTTSRVYIDPALLAEVEIEKSNLTQNGGAGSSAGIVTMRTLNTQDILDDDEDWGGKVNISHGNNSYDFAGDTSVGARVSPKFDVSAAVSRKVIGNYGPGSHNPGLFTTGNGKYYDRDSSRPEYTFLRQTSGLLKANVYLSEDQELNLGYVGSMSNYAKTNDVTNLYNDFNETRVHTLTAKHNWDPESDLINLNTGMYWTRTNNHQFRPARYTTSGTVSTSSFDNDYTLDTFGADIANKSNFVLDPVFDGTSELSFDYGTELFQDKAKTTSELGDEGGYGAAYQVEGSTPGGRRDVYGAYLTTTYGWNDLFTIHGGLRADRYSLTGDTFWCETQASSGNLCEDGGTPLDIDLSENKVSPSFGASITPFNGIQFYANYRENLRAPTVQEALLGGDHIGNVGVPFYSNANLKAEESKTSEVGVNLKFNDVLRKGDGFRAKASYYRSTIDNYTTIAYVPQPTLSGTTTFPVINTTPKQAAAIVNLTDPVYINGTELELSYDADRYYLGGTFTLNDMDLAGNYNPYVLDTAYSQYGNQTYINIIPLNQITISDPIYGGSDQLYGIYSMPKRKITLDGGFRFWDRDLLMGMRATFVTPQDNFGSSKGSSIVGQYFKYRVFDFYSAYQVNDHVTLRFAVTNMLDEAYVQGSGGTYAPAPGRTAILSLSGNF